jgi:hypothetical protein
VAGTTSTPASPNRPPPSPPPPRSDDPDILSQEMLRKYITYAKQHSKPAMQRQDHERIMEVYARLRGEASKTQVRGRGGGVGWGVGGCAGVLCGGRALEVCWLVGAEPAGLGARGSPVVGGAFVLGR